MNYTFSLKARILLVSCMTYKLQFITAAKRGAPTFSEKVSPLEINRSEMPQPKVRERHDNLHNVFRWRKIRILYRNALALK